MRAGKISETGSGNFHLGEVPGVGEGVPNWPHPTQWPQGMWAQGGKWVRAKLELNPIGPMTSLPVMEETQPQRSLLPPPFLQKGSTWESWGVSMRNWKPPSGERRGSLLTPRWRFCTKQTLQPTHMVTGRHLEHSPHMHSRQLWRQTCSSFQG